ncbi:MAG: ATP-dependent DNA helicase, partial [Calditrichales bacterium]
MHQFPGISAMPIRVEDKSIYLSVRDLVQSSAKSFTAIPLPSRGRLGIQAQSRLQENAPRDGSFRREVAVSGTIPFHGYQVHLRGRIDGVCTHPKMTEIEEIKSVLMPPAEFRKLSIDDYPEYCEQVMMYTWLYDKDQGDTPLQPVLRIINLINDKVRVFYPEFSATKTRKLVLERLNDIIIHIEESETTFQNRIGRLAGMSFSLPETRQPQLEMMAAVESCLEMGQHLLVSAPTGTGKTAAVLYPAISFAIKNKKKIVYLTSKTTQQAVVADTLRMLDISRLDMRVCFLAARQKMCINETYLCDVNYCPFLAAFLNHADLSTLVDSWYAQPMASPVEMLAWSKAHGICPAEFMLAAARKADIIVGDSNYLFDPQVSLRSIFSDENNPDWLLIIDEVHNLHPRTMDALSTELDRRDLLNLIKDLKIRGTKTGRELISALSRIDDLFDSCQQEGEINHPEQQYYVFEPDRSEWQEIYDQFESVFLAYLFDRIRRRQLHPEDPVTVFYQHFRQFIQLMRRRGREFFVYYDAAGKGHLAIRCCDPAPYIREILNSFRTAVGMSATLEPLTYYQRILGFSHDRTRLLAVSSPFSSHNRRIVIIPNISTYYRHRMQNYPAYAEIIQRVTAINPGNYLVFFPSFEF